MRRSAVIRRSHVSFYLVLIGPRTIDALLLRLLLLLPLAGDDLWEFRDMSEVEAQV